MARTTPLDPQAAHSLVGDETVTEDAFRIIDEEVKRHGDFILSLKSRRNTFAPISKLPPELLSRIFGFVRQDPQHSLLSWIKVSYVCRTWRSIALNHPSLWAKLPLTYPRWTREMLSRSRNASLTVEVDYVSQSYHTVANDRIASALSHSSRIRHLTLSNVDLVHMQEFLSGMPKHTPRLETLCLSISRRSHVQDPSLNRVACELPPELLSTTDRLRCFEVTQFKFDWDSILSESLTQFKVYDIPSYARPTRTQFWNALKKMPLLESIELGNTFPDPGTSEHDNSSRETIHFSHLQSLAITSSTPEVEGFLQGISCPPTVTVTIGCRGTAVTLQDFTGLVSWISSTLSHPKKSSGLNIRSLAIRTSSPTQGLRFRAFSEALTDDQFLGEAAPKLDLSLGCPTIPNVRPEEVVDKMLVDVFNATSPQGLVSLHLDQQGDFLSTRALTEKFGTLPHLRSVNVVGAIAINLVKALGETLPSKRSTRSKHTQRPSFPALRSISMSNVDLEYDLSLSTLQDMIKTRKKRGAEVHELKLEMCSRISSDDVGDLKDIVPKFVWDGIELGFSEEECGSDRYGYESLYGDDSDMEYDDYDLYGFPF